MDIEISVCDWKDREFESAVKVVEKIECCLRSGGMELESSVLRMELGLLRKIWYGEAKTHC